MNTRHCRLESSESHLIIIIFIYSCSTQRFNKIADFYSKMRIGIKQFFLFYESVDDKSAMVVLAYLVQLVYMIFWI